MPKITFVNKNIEIQVPEGSEFLEIHRRNPELPLKFGCTRGDCGVCAIQVLQGASHLTQESAKEKETLLRTGKGSGYRLACQCAINGDLTVN